MESVDASQLGHGDDEDHSRAFASQEETWRAIRDVLELRQSYLKSKGIENRRHVLTSAERAELVARVSREYEETEEQRALQETDVEKGKANGKGWGTKGGVRKGNAKGKSDGKASPTRGSSHLATGGLPAFLRAQKRKRWCRHLQRVCGTKQISEILAFTGRFDPDFLRKALQSSEQDRDLEEEARVASKSERRRLLHAKAEARARYNEGQRLSKQRDAPSITWWQRDLLERWDSGELLRELNNAVAAWGHGRLRSADDEHLDIGGGTGGVSRRLIDGWVPPDWREFLSHSDTA